MSAASKEDLWSTFDAEQEITRCERIPGCEWRGERTFTLRGRVCFGECEHKFSLE